MEFNVGDRVVCMTRVNGLYDTEGIAGTVVASYERGYEVVFDVNVDGHSLEGRCQYGHDLWINPEYLQPLYLTKKHPNENIYKFKIKEEIKKLSKLQ